MQASQHLIECSIPQLRPFWLGTIQGVTKKMDPPPWLIQPLLEHFSSIFWMFDSRYVLQPHTKQLLYFRYYKTHLYLFYSVYSATYNRNLEDFYLITKYFRGVFYSRASSIQKRLIIAKIRYYFVSFKFVYTKFVNDEYLNKNSSA